MELAITRDRADLEKLEGIIRRNLQSFYEVGKSLAEIRDRELYKIKNGGGYTTFEAYCKGEWGFNRAHAYRFIDSVKVIDNLSPMGDTPRTERQTRPLSKLTPDQQREAWQEAVETAPEGKITAAHVQEVVEKRRPRLDYHIEKEVDLVDEHFKQAWDALFTELKNASQLKWKSTSKQSARKYIQILLDYIER
jgi:hypothetical protein